MIPKINRALNAIEIEGRKKFINWLDENKIIDKLAHTPPRMSLDDYDMLLIKTKEYMELLEKNSQLN